MEEKDYILLPEDLQKAMKINGLPGRLLSRAAYRLLDLHRINAIQRKLRGISGPDFADRVLEEVGVTYDIAPEDLDRIPAQGGFITVSNHPFGSIDGLTLCATVARRRPDYRVLTTFLLALIPGLKDSFMPVDNLTKGGSSRSFTGIRMALSHLADGGPMGFFPAGEVSTWQKKGKRGRPDGKRVIEDRPWADNIAKMIRGAGMPVIPIFFEGTNSRFFHLLGLIHPRLRTVRLIHEMLNKKGTCVKAHFGDAIPPETIAAMDDHTLAKYLRDKCYALAPEN